MKQKKEVFAEGVCIKKALWVFLIGSVFGVIMETIISYFQFGAFESRRGLIYGPLNPVYGFGAVIFMIFLVKYKNPLKVFLGGMLLGGGFEYLCSIMQEIIFGTTSWDYSHQMFNIGGRTSLKYMIIWGILAVLVIKVIYLFLTKLIEKIPVNLGNYMTVILMLFMIFNIIISSFACLRQSERALGFKASNRIEVFLDKHYPDKVLDTIFENYERK